MDTPITESESAKQAFKARSFEDRTFGFGSMGCAIFMSVMVLSWLIDEAFGIRREEKYLFVLGAVSFCFGHLLGIGALFAPKKAVAWWGRTALVTMWVGILVWLFAGIALTE